MNQSIQYAGIFLPLHEDAFDGVDKSKVTIYVPKGCKKHYNNSTWKDFKLVEE